MRRRRARLRHARCHRPRPSGGGAGRRRRPGLLVVLDDLHWADSPTLRCLAHVVGALVPGDRVAVVVTRRPVVSGGSDLAALDAALARHGARTLELEGLAAPEAHDLVTSILGGAADADAVEQWRERTDGNPFFLVELARLAAHSGPASRTRSRRASSRSSGIVSATCPRTSASSCSSRQHWAVSTRRCCSRASPTSIPTSWSTDSRPPRRPASSTAVRGCWPSTTP